MGGPAASATVHSRRRRRRRPQPVPTGPTGRLHGPPPTRWSASRASPSTASSPGRQASSATPLNRP